MTTPGGAPPPAPAADPASPEPGAVPAVTGAPGGSPAATARRTVVAIARDVLATFVLDPVRRNIARSHGGGAPATVAVVLGLLALATATAMVQFAGPLGRGATGVLPQRGPGTVELAPAALVPVLMAMVTVSTTVALVGALHAAPALCALVTGAVGVVGLSLTGFALADDAPAVGVVLGALGTATGVLGPWIARRWLHPTDPPARTRAATVVALPVAAVAAACTVVAPLLAVLDGRLRYGSGFSRDTVTGLWSQVSYELAVLVAPLVYLGGLGFVLVAIATSRLAGRTVDRLGGRSPWLLVAAVLALLAWRWYRLLQVRADQPTGPLLRDAALGVVALGLAALWWRWAARPAGPDDRTPEDGAARTVVVVTVVVLGSDLVTGLLYLLSSLLSSLLPTSSAWSAVAAVGEWLDDGTPETVYRLVAAVGLLGWAVLRRRRGRGGAAVAWTGVAALLDLLRTSRSALTDDRAAVLGDPSVWQDLLVVVVTVALVIEWWGRRSPSRRWLRTAVATLVFSGLVVQQSFVLTGEVASVLAFAGAAAPVLAVLWTLLSAGGHARLEGPRGQGRSLVVVGYLALTASLAVWPLFTGSTAGFLSTDPADAAGRSALGDALTLTVLAVALLRLVRRDVRVRPVAA